MTDTSSSYPRQAARTRNFSLGRPRSLTVTADGATVLFLRSPAGDDPRTALWRMDTATGAESVVVDAAGLLGGQAENLPAEERARRERARETAGGVTAYDTDRDGRRVAFALSGRLHVADVDGGAARELSTPVGVVDPHLSPTGTHVVYCHDRSVRVAEVDGEDRLLVGEDDPSVSWGVADFVAAEEMGRHTGLWWSPDGQTVLAARVDDGPVQRWWIAAPAEPGEAPREVAYPRAGTPNAQVSLTLLPLAGDRLAVPWDFGAFPYLARVSWSAAGLLLLVQTRDQRTTRALLVDPSTGEHQVLAEQTDPYWVELLPGLPALLPDGRLLSTVDADDTRRLTVDGEPVTPPGLQVLGVLDVAADDVLLAATDDPTARQVWRWTPSGVERVSPAEGVHTAARGGGTVVVHGTDLGRDDWVALARTADGAEHRIATFAETPVLQAAVRLLTAGPRDLRCALILPTGHVAGAQLPVLLDPYGGPGHSMVTQARGGFRESQWFADQGFAVLVADGRGTPARGPAWERAIARDWADAVLTDQVDALLAVAAEEPDLDLTRVAIRGWSFGGYLAALAALRRPDVFHAAVAGAPVIDWTLYDTHYTERYLGTDPEGADAARYAAASLIDDAHRLERPLMLVHGLADDNVVVAHTLRLSTALLAAGRPHEVLPLSGITHMTSEQVVAENLLLLQLEFLRRSLSL